ncbi:MAG: NPCBM/NEW2 domain-containing protein, partial [Bacteroidales bacterium]
SNDFWDNWAQLKNQFSLLSQWTGLGAPGNYPDGDMLPLGKIGLRAERGQARWTGFTHDEQYTLMTLFAIFRSPLMFGGDLPSNDEFALSLLTNKAVINVNQNSTNGKQLFREKDLIAWTADDPATGDKYLALFNATDKLPVVEEKALWKSTQLTHEMDDQSVVVDLDITGAKKLYLVTASDDVAGFSSHSCNWVEPQLFFGNNRINLTDVPWVRASAGRGKPTINRKAGGGVMYVNGREVTNGISANAPSIIEYDLPESVTRFRAVAGLDNGFASTSGQDNTIMHSRPNNGRFMVFTTDPSGPEPGPTAIITVSFEKMGISGTYSVTDLWTGKTLGNFTGEFSQTINRHGAGLYRLSRKK